ncbi:glycosyltransferase family 2 protein [Subtercola sp. YIM 133946]|uniref:glycosyltransferase family 2 protein n=1 Tax=Subtercola sp. YIM 133946 TaxID=3118909 RepID=UPI002F91F5B2
MTTTPNAVSLTIAVLTFNRPADIAEVLPLLLDQAASVRDRADARVLVIDNEPNASARGVVQNAAEAASAARRAPGIVVHYVHEPIAGITAARNRALDESRDSDLLVFIDDDERPSEAWLASMLDLQARTGCAAVAGPVASEFEVQPSAFIAAGRFFVRVGHATGDSLDVAATNNLLLDLRQIRAFGLSFDAGLGVSGGEDTLFTRQIVAHGGQMLWSNEARVVDVVPRARLTRRWVVRRAFSSGNSWSLTSLMLAEAGSERWLVRLRLTVRGLIRAAGGLARIVAGLLTNRLDFRARGLRTLARGAGMVGGAWGYTYREYRRVEAD